MSKQTKFKEVVDLLAIKGEVRVDATVAAITKKSDGFELTFEDGEKLDAEIVVTAVPSYALADMVEEMTIVMADVLRAIPYAPMNMPVRTISGCP